jgi:gas vesicle protein
MSSRWTDITKEYLYNSNSILLGVLLGLTILVICVIIIVKYLSSETGSQKINSKLKKYNTSIEQIKTEIKNLFKK